MFARPDQLRDRFNICLPKLLRLDASFHRRPQVPVRFHAHRRLLEVALIVARMLRVVDERHLVVVGVLQPEVDVSAASGSESLDGFLTVPGDGFHALGEFGKGLFTNGVEQRSLVFKVKIDRGRRVFDLLGDTPHRDVLVALFHEQLTRGIENVLPERFLLSRSSLLRSHSVYQFNDVLSLNGVKHTLTLARVKKFLREAGVRLLGLLVIC